MTKRVDCTLNWLRLENDLKSALISTTLQQYKHTNIVYLSGLKAPLLEFLLITYSWLALSQ
jgi:hypothetical protein